MVKQFEISPGRQELVSSVGVLIHTTPLRPVQPKPHFLLVQQNDQPNKPWGIPAGRVEDSDKSAEAAAAREVLEETGLEIDPQTLRLFLVAESYFGVIPGTIRLDYKGDIETKKIIYSCQTPLEVLLRLGDWQVVYPYTIKSGRTEYAQPDIYLLNTSQNPEIAAMSLVPAVRMYDRSNRITNPAYRWDTGVLIKDRLKSLRVI